MALPVFAPDPAPSPDRRSTPRLSLREAPFGDGYTQASPAGINSIRKILELNWPVLTQAQHDALEAFFVARRGTDAFTFQPHGFPAALKWTCKTWSSSGTAPFSFSATLEQSFTLEN